jgi:CDGSH-type Zn-finger protein
MTNQKNAPIKVDVEEGEKYSWCSCGLSGTIPFCDGTHKTAETDKSSVKFVPEQTGSVYLCACGKTQNAPYCDGSHQHQD